MISHAKVIYTPQNLQLFNSIIQNPPYFDPFDALGPVSLPEHAQATKKRFFWIYIASKVFFIQHLYVFLSVEERGKENCGSLSMCVITICAKSDAGTHLRYLVSRWYATIPRLRANMGDLVHVHCGRWEKWEHLFRQRLMEDPHASFKNSRSHRSISLKSGLVSTLMLTNMENSLLCAQKSLRNTQ